MNRTYLRGNARCVGVSACVRLSYPDHVVDTVDIGVPHVDSDGAQREAVPLPRALDGDGRAQSADGWRVVPAGGRVAGRRVG